MKRDLENLFYDDYLSASARDFIESSKMHEYDYLEYSQHLESVMESPYYMSQINGHTTELGNLPEIALPDNLDASEEYKVLRQILLNRKSIREYYPEGISISHLSLLIRNSYFITSKNNLATRCIPSGGGLYPIELYYISLNTIDLSNGIYHYDINTESLQQLKLLDISLLNKIEHSFYSKHRIDIDFKNASGVLILAGILNKTSLKYMDRGVRFILIETGAIMQNIYLNAAVLKMGCCACGGYIDDRVSELLDFKTKDQTILSTLIIGKLAGENE
jgi:SagB-type dehydrogenase family enzyme